MDERADELSRLYLSEGPVVWGFAVRRVGTASEADEILQETFLVAAKDFEAVRAAVSARAWLLGIARNVIQQRHRWFRRRKTVELPYDYPDPPTEQPDSRIEFMRAAIRRLPQLQREIMELRLGNELSYAEIAEMLRIPIGTVRSRLHAAVASLRKKAEEIALGAVP